MPRVYKPKPNAKRYRKYDEVTLRKAVVEARSNPDESISNIAMKYNITKSVLHRHYKKRMKPHGGQPVLSKKAEKYIVDTINISTGWGYRLDITDFRQLIKMYLDSKGIKQKKFKDNLPGIEFVRSFLRRNAAELSQKITNRKRRSMVTSELALKYFAHLKQTLENVSVDNIVCYDEFGLCDDPENDKVLSKRTYKYSDQCKTPVSLMITGTALGEMFSPYVVYESTQIFDTLCVYGSKDAVYNRTSSGWVDGATFADWIKRTILPYFSKKEGKKCIIGNNMNTFLSIDLIEFCKTRDIHFVIIPTNIDKYANAIHNALFVPIKNAWQQILMEWKKTNYQETVCTPKSNFPVLLKFLFDELQNNSQYIKNGFRKTGIIPLDSSELISRLPIDEDENIEYKNNKETIVKDEINNEFENNSNVKPQTVHNADFGEQNLIRDIHEKIDYINSVNTSEHVKNYDDVKEENCEGEEMNVEVLDEDIVGSVIQNFIIMDDCIVFVVE